MAISEACQFEIKEEVDKACEVKGISKHEAFQALETFYNKIGVPVTFSTIKRKYYRATEKVTNVTPLLTPENHSGIQENRRDEKGQFSKGHSGNPEGRKPKHNGKRKMSQKTAWKKVERLLRELTEFMKKNCEIEPNITEISKINIRAYIDLLVSYKDEL